MNLQNRFPDWPQYDEQEEKLLIDVLNNRQWWRMSGTMIKQFEEKFAKHHHTDYALAVTNGTHAIELALMALEVKPGDEVIVPAFTFISTVLPVMKLGAIPVVVDVDPDTFCIDPLKVREALSPRTVGVIPVHMAGHMCDMDSLLEITKEHQLFIVEDACHAHGGEWKNRRAGSIGDCGVYSFQAFKLMTAGEGGALVSNSKELYEKAFLYHNVGRPEGDKSYRHLVLGSNYRLSEFQAAVLLPQIHRLDEQNQIRERNAKALDREMSRIEGIKPQGRREECNIHTHYMYMFYYDSKAFGGLSRAEFTEKLNRAGIPAYIAYSQIHETIAFKNYLNSLGSYRFANDLHCPVSQKISEEVVWIHHRALLGDEMTAIGIAKTIQEIQKSNAAKV